MENEYDKYGLKIGLEIHFQLDTGRKLFCRCPIGLEEDGDLKFYRRLRPTQSELGQVDPAAYFEFKKGLIIEYIASNKYNCLVEMDEEPPHSIDRESLITSLRIASYMHSLIVDEIHVMRKIVVDGSNTSGFQRTAIIGLNGYIDIKEINKRVPIQTICLEEEAARLAKREGRKVTYLLDRLGIPLIEIATAPVIHSPDEAVKIALGIGRIVRATGKKRRGLGSVRQDVNISIMDGNVVEVKGVQKIPQLRKVVDFEFKRQVGLYQISRILRQRDIRKDDILSSTIKDVSNIFRNTRNKIIRRLLEAGGRVVAIKLKGFSGLIGMETAPGYRLGKELVERVRFWTGLKGIFHTDELPKYGISEEEVAELKNSMNVKDDDAVVFVVADKTIAYEAIEKIKERAVESLDGVPSETRGSREDGSTFYMRPRPGMARMYPETDIPPIYVSRDLMKKVHENPLQDPEDIISEIVKQYEVKEDLAWKLYDAEYIDLFKKIVESTHNLSVNFIASFLTDTLKYLERKGLDMASATDSLIFEIFRAVEEGKIRKESVTDVLEKCITERIPVEEAIESLGLGESISLSELKTIILKILSERKDLHELPKEILRKRIMAIIMSKYRGKVNPGDAINLINEILEGDDFE